MLQVFSSWCCKSWSECCIYMAVASVCFKRFSFIHLLQVFHLDVAYVCNGCMFWSVSLSFFMLQLLHLNISKVDRMLHIDALGKGLAARPLLRCSFTSLALVLTCSLSGYRPTLTSRIRRPSASKSVIINLQVRILFSMDRYLYKWIQISLVLNGQLVSHSMRHMSSYFGKMVTSDNIYFLLFSSVHTKGVFSSGVVKFSEYYSTCVTIVISVQSWTN
jgi:hypothetical protein